MKDFTRAELADLQDVVRRVEAGEDVEINYTAIRTLLAMASRSVSEETVRMLAASFSFADEAFDARQADRMSEAKFANDDALDADSRFHQMAKKDLKEAASDLARGGKDG